MMMDLVVFAPHPLGAISIQQQAGVFLGWGRHPSKTLALGAFLTLFSTPNLLHAYSIGASLSPIFRLFEGHIRQILLK